MEPKTFCLYFIIPTMYYRVNLKMKKPTFYVVLHG